jgi:hypothetical protein
MTGISREELKKNRPNGSNGILRRFGLVPIMDIVKTRRALRFAIKYFCDMQGEKITKRDVEQFLDEIRKIERS